MAPPGLTTKQLLPALWLQTHKHTHTHSLNCVSVHLVVTTAGDSNQPWNTVSLCPSVLCLFHCILLQLSLTFQFFGSYCKCTILLCSVQTSTILHIFIPSCNKDRSVFADHDVGIFRFLCLRAQIDDVGYIKTIWLGFTFNVDSHRLFAP